MRSLASFSMQGRSQAVMVATVLAVLSLILPPLSILSAAVVALVTLRQGPRSGMLVILLSMLACALLAAVLRHQIALVVGFVLLMWLPVWLLGVMLRLNRSLGVTLTAALMLGLFVLAWQYVQSPDPVAAWRELLQPLVAGLIESELIAVDQSEVLVELAASWMPGGIAVGFMVQSMTSLLLARWWQAMLYNPGGFRDEFHSLRVPKPVALITILVLSLKLLDLGGMAVAYLYLLLLTVWCIQGLAVVHGLRYRLQASIAWLAALYGMMFFALVFVVNILAAVGFADAWVDIRSRVRPAGGSNPQS